MRLRISYLIALFVISLSANAEFFTGSQLKQKLEEWDSTSSSKSYYEGASGSGYVIGVFDTFSGIKYCAPSGITVGQVTSMVLKHLRENPEKLELSADRHVVHVFNNAWPCPVKQPAAPAPQAKHKNKPQSQDESPF